MDSLRELERERGISFETVVEAIEKALASAYLRVINADETRDARAVIDRDTGEVTVFAQEIEIKENEEGEEVERVVLREWEDTPADFGRIAAQTAKQVILQRLREAERDITFGEYSGREGDIVTGIVQQQDHRYTILDLGKTEALMPPSEQIPHERYEHGARLKAYIVEVRKSARGPQIIVSRTHPGLIKRLFELEVPEILDGIVEIRSVAREPGHRSKIAVVSNDANVDPVGACVGAKGSRVRMVMNELRGEKIDIIKWTEDGHDFVANALSPAKVKEVQIQDDGETALVIVPDYQLSLAIGKEGQNARLAARLTGLRVDIKSESQIKAEKQAAEPPPEAAEAQPTEA
jgi:N utilization substance protein A